MKLFKKGSAEMWGDILKWVGIAILIVIVLALIIAPAVPNIINAAERLFGWV